MKVVKSIVCLSMLLGAASPAFSQRVTDTESEKPARYVAGSIGAASFASETIATFAGEYGEPMGRFAQAYANLSYFDNLMNEQMRANLVEAGDTLTAVTGFSRAFSGRDRAIAFTMGGKFVVPSGSAFRPYIGAGVGSLHLRRTIREQSLGDVTTSFVTQSGLNDGVIDAGSESATKPMTEIVAGVGISAGRTYIDVGYRYRKAFHTAQPIDFSQFGAGIGVRF